MAARHIPTNRDSVPDFVTVIVADGLSGTVSKLDRIRASGLHELCMLHRESRLCCYFRPVVIFGTSSDCTSHPSLQNKPVSRKSVILILGCTTYLPAARISVTLKYCETCYHHDSLAASVLLIKGFTLPRQLD